MTARGARAMQTKITKIYQQNGVIYNHIRVNNLQIQNKIGNVETEPIYIDISLLAELGKVFSPTKINLDIERVDFKHQKDFHDIKPFLTSNMKQILDWNNFVTIIEAQYLETVKRVNLWDKNKDDIQALINFIKSFLQITNSKQINVLDLTIFQKGNHLHTVEADNERFLEEGVFYDCVYNVGNVDAYQLPNYRAAINMDSKFSSYYDLMKLFHLKGYILEKIGRTVLEVSNL